MIVTIRGTSGSGKSTLVRRIMDHYHAREPTFVEGRKNPLFYDLDHADERVRPLRVLGHYETATGGGDTISQGLDYVDQLARAGRSTGRSVLYEGLVISSDFRRIVALHKEGHDVLVIALNTSIEECLESVRQRRAAKGNLSPLNPKSTESKHRAVLNMIPRFRAEGVPTEHIDRETAYQLLADRFGISGASA